MALDWFQIAFGVKDIENRKHIVFERDFADRKAAADGSEEAALFFLENPYGKGRTYFFPRVAKTFWSELIKTYPTVSYSPKPNGRSLTVAVGDDSHRQFWFNN